LPAYFRQGAAIRILISEQLLHLVNQYPNQFENSRKTETMKVFSGNSPRVWVSDKNTQKILNQYFQSLSPNSNTQRPTLALDRSVCECEGVVGEIVG
jgi:hypothetical protein